MRTWTPDCEDTSVHCLGNGRLCVYEQGPTVLQVVGPPYSAPAILALGFAGDLVGAVDSTREPGTAVWRHRVRCEGRETAVLDDIVDPDRPCFLRRIRTHAPLRIPLLRLQQQVRTIPYRTATGVPAVLITADSGLFVYSDYPFPEPVFHAVAVTGAAKIENGRDGEPVVCCTPGESLLCVAGGPAYPEAVLHVEQALASSFEDRLRASQRWWTGFSDSRPESTVPAEGPEAERLASVVDSVATLVKAQQGIEGGVLAGYPYHMGYVRDQYGVARGLLAMGHALEARGILEFYWSVWQRHGLIRNAQGIGVDGVFHVHENDDVEITGYLLLQASDYLRATGDEAFVAEITPMLGWAFRAQIPHLVRGMLPFNGDETYVAGGILPRTALNDGAAEATLLFLEGGQRFLDWVQRKRLWSDRQVREGRTCLERVRTVYATNFITDQGLITNNPERRKLAELPRFRRGVCEACHAITWTEKTRTARYVCPRCREGKTELPAGPETVYALQSVALTPLYFGTEIVPRSVPVSQIQGIVDRYRETGALPSRPEGGRSVGYDYGFVLYALTALGHADAGLLFRQTLDIVDSVGAYAEYYADHRPEGTRCRPWESAINVEALLAYARAGGPRHG